MTSKEKLSFLIRCGLRFSDDESRIMDIIREEINKTSTTSEVINERPTGEWKCFIGSAYYGVDEDYEPIWRERKIYHCPFCHRRTVIKENYCPNCGAKMKGAEE